MAAEQSIAGTMVRTPAVHPPSTTVGELRTFFDDEHVHAALLVDGTRLIGVVERADIAAELADELPARSVATLRDRTIDPAAGARDTLESMKLAGRRRLAVVAEDGALVGLLCLKSNGGGFCSDTDVGSRGGSALDGVWDVHRTGGALPPMRGIVRKRIENGRGWTIAAGVRFPFVVEGLSLRYPFGLVDDLVPDGADAYAGAATLFGRTVGTFRLTRARR